MKSNHLLLIWMAAAMSLITSCEVIGGIFKAGVWTGIIIVVAVVGIIIWLISKAGGK